MFKKYLIVASKKDLAGINITTNLSQFESDKFKFYLVDEEIIHTENLDLEKINEYDFIIFASKHQSEKQEKTLSLHAPGNFRTNDFGGEKEKVCPASALLNKLLFENLNKFAKQSRLEKYKVTLECTHHGPLIDKPCVFIEIGATETEWKDRRAGFAVAKTIIETIEDFKPSEFREIAVGIGGPHYCPNFNKIQINSNVAIAHIIPQYVTPITERYILEPINKTIEELDFVVLDWKGLGPSDKRHEVINILEKNYIPWKKISDVKR